MCIIRRGNKKRFVSLATLKHNANIETIQYANPKIAKRLFFAGAVLPDFKISWGILIIYLFVKYPLSLRVRLRNALREFKLSLCLFIEKGVYRI